jgi:hypothetical protein
MRSTLFRFAIAGLASLALATSASADTILQFTQQNTAVTPIVATDSATGTTFTTTGTGSTGGSVPVLIGFLGAPPTVVAFETFTTPLTSTTAGTVVSGQVNQTGYAGTIRFSLLAGGGGTNFLTAVFTGGAVSGPQNGNSAGLAASQPPTTVTFTSDIPAITAAIAASPGRNFALSFSGLTSPLVLTGPLPTIDGFLASNTGTFSTIIPEPSSIVMASISALAGLGCLGLRRFKATQA